MRLRSGLGDSDRRELRNLRDTGLAAEEEAQRGFVCRRCLADWTGHDGIVTDIARLPLAGS
jgi:hypothetical protein